MMNHNSVEILLVEDNLSDAELTIRELKKNHLANNLYHAHDGEEAVDFIFGTGKFEDTRNVAFSPKVVLLDIKMPKMNGIDVLKLIKSNELTKKIPVVILTSSKEDPDIKACYSLGANSYIVKPVNFQNFVQAIRDLGFYWLLLNQPPK